MKNLKQTRLVELDALRGIAALAVVLVHYTYVYERDYGHAETFPFTFYFGHLGVQLFFIISGFVILMSLEKTKRPLDFIISRFSRIYPTYWVAVIFTFTILTFSNLPKEQPEVLNFFVNLTMLQKWLKVKNIDVVYWTLSVELCFYLYMLILLVTRKLRHIELIGSIWLGLKAVLSFVHLPDMEFIRFVFFLEYVNLFFAGVLFYNLKTKGNSIRRHGLIFICYCFEILKTYKHAKTTPLYSSQEEFIYSAIIVTGIFMVFYVLIYGRMPFLKNRILTYLGSVSYALYVVHFQVGLVIIHNLFRLNLNPSLVLMITIGVAVALAALITHYVEKPVQQWVRNAYKKRREQPVLEPVAR
jgi:peptidoglycan/LPS O-acetylase OafA/YrhL